MNEPQMIGHYQVVELLGAGAMGNVHIAFDTLIEREVAIKSLRPELTRDPESVQRLKAEARSLARLNHPNITTLYSLLDSGDLYMVMELVRGRPLDEILRDRQGPLGVKESLAIISQVADGLSYAHQMGVIHRDIKPSNLMIAEDGRVKIMDFGIARVRGSVRLTRAGTAIGTLLYMSPEQCRGEAGDERSDLYSLAMVLYEMLAGKPAFDCDNEYNLIQAQINSRPPVLVPHVPGVSPELESKLMIALAKRPEQRFVSVRAFSDAIGATGFRIDATAIVRNAEHLVEAPAMRQDRVVRQGLPARTLALVRSRARALWRRLKGCHPAVQGMAVGGTCVAILVLALIASDAPRPPAPTRPAASVETQPSRPVTRTEPSQMVKPESAPAVRIDSSQSIVTEPAIAPARSRSSELRRQEAVVDTRRADTVYNNTFAAGERQPSTIPATAELSKEAVPETKFDRAERAAKAGDRHAGFELGMAYLKTPGRQNLVDAFKWLKMSAELGDPDAQSALGKMYQNGDAEGGQNEREAVRWYTKSAEQNNAEGQYWLGRAYEVGAGGLKKDRKRAEDLYFLAKIQGHPRAEEALEKLRKSSR
jgi:serine/threonine protein kinase